MNALNLIKQGFLKTVQVVNNSREFIYGLIIYAACRPEVVMAGKLSAGLCKTYRSIVDNELFVVLATVASAILLIVWKMAPAGGILAKAVGVLAALTIAINLESILNSATGVSLGC